jgi:hypothetical protein
MYGNNIYLADGTEFEVELFNPSDETLGVKFKMNGKYISDNHLVLYPGKRMHLDRHLNEAKKFKYVTYTVEDTKESRDAMAKNGLVEVEFYREYQEPRTQNAAQGIRGYFTSTNLNSDTLNINNSTGYCNLSNTNSLYGYPNNAQAPIGLSGHTGPVGTPGISLSDVTEKNEVETGMVNKGTASSTAFTSVDMAFEVLSVSWKTFKILPLSQKPIEAKDLIIYCTVCQKKARKGDTYCAGCGHKHE